MPLLVLLLLSPLLIACAGQPCDDLPQLRAERDAARQDYAELVGGGTAASEVTSRADEELHALDRRVFELEQDCGRP